MDKMTKSQKNKGKTQLHSIDIYIQYVDMPDKLERFRFCEGYTKKIKETILENMSDIPTDIATLITEFSHPIPKPGIFYRKNPLYYAACSDIKKYGSSYRRVKKRGLKSFLYFLDPFKYNPKDKMHTNMSHFLDHLASEGNIMKICFNFYRKIQKKKGILTRILEIHKYEIADYFPYERTFTIPDYFLTVNPWKRTTGKIDEYYKYLFIFGLDL